MAGLRPSSGRGGGFFRPGRDLQLAPFGDDAKFYLLTAELFCQCRPLSGEVSVELLAARCRPTQGAFLVGFEHLLVGRFIFVLPARMFLVGCGRGCRPATADMALVAAFVHQPQNPVPVAGIGVVAGRQAFVAEAQVGLHDAPVDELAQTLLQLFPFTQRFTFFLSGKIPLVENFQFP